MELLTDDILRNIYEYDRTYRDIFKHVLLEINKRRQEEINIFLQMPDLGVMLPLKIFTTETIYYIKHCAKQIYGIHYDETPCIEERKHIRVEYKYNTLEDEKDLNDYNIRDGMALMVWFNTPRTKTGKHKQNRR